MQESTLPTDHTLAHCVAQALRMSTRFESIFWKKYGRITDLESVAYLHREEHLFYLVTKRRCHGKQLVDDQRELDHFGVMADRLGY